MSELLTQGIVRILDSNLNIAGTGFVISEFGLIATCSHVVQHEALQERGTPRPEKVTVVFHATGDEQDALVEPQWWLPWNAGDLAIIRVEGILPQGVQPLPLGLAEGTSGHKISTFGFPDVDSIEGLGGDGRVVRVLPGAGRPVLQLQSNEITVGFSGAPIWDKLGRRVIGMVSAITEPDRHHRLAETAFALSTETLRDVCPALHLSEVCPYRGLTAFTEADTEFFFGRQQIVDELLSRLQRDPRFLMVLGPSGSGKSSLVQAGLIPQLRSGKVPGSDRWGVIVTRPTAQPFDELIKQGGGDESHDLTENVQIWLNQHTEQGRLMLVIDQFEELLSICPEAIRQDFIIQLVKLLHSPLPITIVLVMRDDYYSRLTQQEALVEWLEQSRGPMHVPRFLKQGELIAIVQKPIEAVGLRIEEGLVETIVKDTLETSSEAEEGGQVGRSAVLPLLEFALTELWERRQGGMLTHEAYRSIGGVAGALPQWADRAFYALKPSERRLAQRILISLVYIGDKSQGILDSRRRRTLTSLSQNVDEQESVEQGVVQHLVENRLLATDRDLQSNEETVEIIHDVLLRKWGLLQEWLEEDRRFLTWHQGLERLVYGWTTLRDNSKLLRGRDLNEAKGWLKERGADLSQDEAAFLRASAAHRMRFIASMLAIVLLLLSTTGVASWYYVHQPPDPTRVSNLQDNSNPGSLRYAVDDASPKSTITFDTSLHGTILLSSDLYIAKDLTIRGPGAGILSISSGTSGHSVHTTPGVSVTISGLTFKNSKTSNNSFIDNKGTLMLVSSIVTGNAMTVEGSVAAGPGPGDGGGIYNGGTLTLNNSTVSGNTSRGTGGGIYSYGKLTLNNSTVSGNTAMAYFGGGIANNGRLTLNNSTVSGNTSQGTGGGIYNGDMLTLNNSTVSGNTSQDEGGGIYNIGTLTLNNTAVSGNKLQGGGSGGGIYSSNILILNNSIVSDNTSRGKGGGIAGIGTFALSNSTVSDNTATGFGGGITIIARPQDSNRFIQVMLLYCTVYGNTANIGGGIWVDNIEKQDQVSMRASIIAGNSAHSSPDITGSLISLGYNLVGDRSGATFLDPLNKLSTDVLGVSLTDLKIDPVLRDNGGSTKTHTLTHALLPGSPAIDQIPLDACLIKATIPLPSAQPEGPRPPIIITISTDQRSMKRPDKNESACDIGAYEYVDSST